MPKAVKRGPFEPAGSDELEALVRHFRTCDNIESARAALSKVFVHLEESGDVAGMDQALELEQRFMDLMRHIYLNRGARTAGSPQGAAAAAAGVKR